MRVWHAVGITTVMVPRHTPRRYDAYHRSLCPPPCA